MDNFDIHSKDDFWKFMTDGEDKNIQKVRAHNALRRSGINDIESFAKESPCLFPLMRNVGTKTLQFIEEKHAEARHYLGLNPEKLSEEEIQDIVTYKREQGWMNLDKLKDATKTFSLKYGRASY